MNRSGGTAEHLWGGGAVAELEGKLRDHYRMPYALAMTSATTALFGVALALDVAGGEVITTPLSWGGAVGAFIEAGAQPVFADVDPFTLTLRPDAVRTAITPRTRAILAVDLYGVPCDHQSLRLIAEDYNLWFIQDAAQSLGAWRFGRPAGASAHVVATSFTSGKTVDAGEGGAVLTESVDLYRALIHRTQHPYRQKRDLGLRATNEFALNLRIHPIGAAWANADFEASLRRLADRQSAAALLLDALDAAPQVQPVRHRAHGIIGTEFKTTAPWRNRQNASRLTRELRGQGFEGHIRPIVMSPLYHHPGLRARCPNIPQPVCPVAEDQCKRRFEFIPTQAVQR